MKIQVGFRDHLQVIKINTYKQQIKRNSQQREEIAKSFMSRNTYVVLIFVFWRLALCSLDLAVLKKRMEYNVAVYKNYRNLKPQFRKITNHWGKSKVIPVFLHICTTMKDKKLFGYRFFNFFTQLESSL